MERWARTPAAQGGTVRRPLGTGAFDLTYLRTGPRGSGPPVVVIPGGPGLASAIPYRALRGQATARGLDVIMVEHRGVGLSRLDNTGADLPVPEVTITHAVDDIAAVLDHCGVERAVIHGSSYGTYLAQGFGVRHPHRVAGMVLDSPMLTAHDVDVVRSHLRGLLWDGGTPGTVRCATLLRQLVVGDLVPVAQVGPVAQVVYEFAGPTVLERLLELRLAGRARRTWDRIAGLGRGEVDGPGSRFVMEPELVSGIAYGELNYGAVPDGHPLDPQTTFAAAAARYTTFAGEPFDLPVELGRFDWPTAVVSGDRDLRTPRPVAERIVGLVPGAVLVPLPGLGHSALDTHALAALHVAHAVAVGGHRRLPGLAARIGALPRRGAPRWIGRMIAAAVAAHP